MSIHGGDIYPFIQKGIVPLDFSANINPLGMPKGVKKLLIEKINSFSNYPDINCNELKDSVSIFENVLRDYILFGNGAADLIFKLVFAIKPKKALLLSPTFSEYEMALKNVDCEINHYPLSPLNDFKLETSILEKISENSIVFICNPNNPTGMVIEKSLVLEIAKKCLLKNSILVIDECFMDFVSDNEKYSFKEHISEFNNVIILKAFTKFFALAGLRLGYCICSNKILLENINSQGQPWSVSSPAQIAGVYALKEKDYIKNSVSLISKERQYLENQLIKLGFKVFKSYTNFILFKTKQTDIYQLLLANGILIRKCENFSGLDKTYFRIAVKNHSDNKKLIGAIKNG